MNWSHGLMVLVGLSDSPADEERPLVHACATICNYEAGQGRKGGKN